MDRYYENSEWDDMDEDNLDNEVFTGKIYIKCRNYYFIYKLGSQKILYGDLKNRLNEIFYENYDIIDNIEYSGDTTIIFLENFGKIYYVHPPKNKRKNLEKVLSKIFDCRFSLNNRDYF